MSLVEILGQIFGFVALAFYIYAYQLKDPRKSMLWFAPGTVFFGLHCWLLGSFSAALMMIASATKDLFGAFAADKWLRMIVVSYITLVWGIVFFTVDVWPELLAPAATSLSAVASLLRNYFYPFRIVLIFHHLMWIAFNLWLGSYAGVILVMFTGSSNLIGIYRFYKGQKLSGFQKHIPLEP